MYSVIGISFNLLFVQIASSIFPGSRSGTHVSGIRAVQEGQSQAGGLSANTRNSSSRFCTFETTSSIFFNVSSGPSERSPILLFKESALPFEIPAQFIIWSSNRVQNSNHHACLLLSSIFIIKYLQFLSSAINCMGHAAPSLSGLHSSRAKILAESSYCVYSNSIRQVNVSSKNMRQDIALPHDHTEIKSQQIHNWKDLLG